MTQAINDMANVLIAAGAKHRGMEAVTIDTVAKEGRQYWIDLAEAAVWHSRVKGPDHVDVNEAMEWLAKIKYEMRKDVTPWEKLQEFERVMLREAERAIATQIARM